MQYLPTRSSSNTPLVLAAVGIGALLAYALSSPRRRAQLRAAGESALEAGSRLATTSADRIGSLLPERAVAAASGLTSAARAQSSRATTAAADTLHEAVDRATEVMHDVLTRARGLTGEAKRAAREQESRIEAPAEEMIEATPHHARRSSGHGGTMLAVAAIGAGLYAMQRYGAIDRLRGTLGAGEVDETGALQVEKSIYIDAPVEQVFDTWSDVQNFPRFMSNVESVQPLDGDRSHWKVKGPVGVAVEWNAVTTKNRPRELSWRSEAGSTVDNEGRVTLVPQGSGTRATVQMSYRPPAGALGDAVSSLFGANPRREFEEDLTRMKQYIEGQRSRSGVSASSGAVPLQPV